MNIAVANRQRTKKINSRLLKKIAADILTGLKTNDGELGLNLVGEKEMAAVNWQFLRHEGSTDVITFNHSNPPAPLSGELFICIAETVRQAKKFKTTWQSELVRYLVHGILHLLGHDDLRLAPRRKMKRMENRLVRELSRRFALSKLQGDSKLWHGI